jgi:hypothetical protein
MSDYVHIGIVTEHDDEIGYLTEDGFVKKLSRFEELPSVCILRPEAAQELMDDLFRCGIRPSSGKGSSGQLAATEKHLSDMRKIVARKLGMEL